MTITRRLANVERSLAQDTRGSFPSPVVTRRLMEIQAAQEGVTVEEWLADVEERQPYGDLDHTSWPEFIRQVAEREDVPAAELHAELDRMIEEARASLALESL